MERVGSKYPRYLIQGKKEIRWPQVVRNGITAVRQECHYDRRCWGRKWLVLDPWGGKTQEVDFELSLNN